MVRVRVRVWVRVRVRVIKYAYEICKPCFMFLYLHPE